MLLEHLSPPESEKKHEGRYETKMSPVKRQRNNGLVDATNMSLEDSRPGTCADGQQFQIGCHMVKVWLLLQSDDPLPFKMEQRVLIQRRAGEA